MHSMASVLLTFFMSLTGAGLMTYWGVRVLLLITNTKVEVDAILDEDARLVRQLWLAIRAVLGGQLLVY